MPARFKPVPDDCYITHGFGPDNGKTYYGVDFGKAGGSGNQPVYAAQAGTVVYAGAARGFGGPAPAGWVVVDHPTEAGSGTTVYGSVVGEVTVGEWVHAGQRIAHINPDPNTNGGYAPHLHFEVHPLEWRAGSQIDPVPWLGTAPAPTPEQSNPPIHYGVDISNHQPNINCHTIKAEGFRFAIIKATEGTWQDPYCAHHVTQARAAGLHTAAYAYVHSETSPQAHATALTATINDPTVPTCLDIETNSGTDPAHWLAIKDTIEAHGHRVILTYLPRWYWQQVGTPNLVGLPPLWSSHYAEPQQGYAADIYQRAGSAGWHSYGGVLTQLWQFSSQAAVAGHEIDVNAFRGTATDLAQLFGN
ncbi:MAG: GH25 family lysozyme [Corynebacterium sp.]|nr:GH25 family lysozyme [Corynebacterium sp.]